MTYSIFGSFAYEYSHDIVCDNLIFICNPEEGV